MKKTRISRINPDNATLVASLQQKRLNTINKTKLNAAPNKPAPTSTKNRGPKNESIYATPVPKRYHTQVTAEENLFQWGMRRGLPIEKIRIIAAELRKSSQQQQQN